MDKRILRKKAHLIYDGTSELDSAITLLNALQNMKIPIFISDSNNQPHMIKRLDGIIITVQMYGEFEPFDGKNKEG